MFVESRRNHMIAKHVLICNNELFTGIYILQLIMPNRVLFCHWFTIVTILNVYNRVGKQTCPNMVGHICVQCIYILSTMYVCIDIVIYVYIKQPVQIFILDFRSKKLRNVLKQMKNKFSEFYFFTYNRSKILIFSSIWLKIICSETDFGFLSVFVCDV